jgi:hypothetical protein
MPLQAVATVPASPETVHAPGTGHWLLAGERSGQAVDATLAHLGAAPVPRTEGLTLRAGALSGPPETRPDTHDGPGARPAGAQRPTA